jgi:hypothetical protein
MPEVHGINIEGNRIVLTVDCEGHKHTATIEDRKLRLDNHDEETLDAFTTFGAKPPECYELLQMWRRDPVALLRVLAILPAKPDGLYHYLDASTAHITEEDSRVLENLADGEWYISREYGWWVWIDVDNETKQQQTLRDLGLSESFINLVRYAADNYCWWLLLDQDGTNIDPLPLHDW